MPSTTQPARKRRAYAPRVPPPQRRDQLLDATLHVVVTKGHAAATMDTVAEEAGVTKPVVYGQFRNRAELLAALLRREQTQGLQQLLATLPADLDQRLDAEPGEVLPQVLANFLQAVREKPERWHCIVMPMADMPAEFHAAREQARLVALARAERLVRRVFDHIGAPPDLPADLAAHGLVCTFEMAARLLLTDPGRHRPERFVCAIRAAVGLTRPRP